MKGRGSIALSAAIAIAALAPGAAHAATQSCAVAGKTISANGGARVFTTGKAQHRFVYVCAYRPGKSLLLVHEHPERRTPVSIGFRGAVLNGARVTWQQDRCIPLHCTITTRTLDITSRKVVRHATSNADSVTSYVAPNGSFVLKTADGHGGVYLTSYDSSGKHLLDSVYLEDLDRIAIGDGIVYWRHGSELRSASLAGKALAIEATASGPAHGSCFDRGATVAANSVARVFSVGPPGSRVLYACRYGSAPRRLLTESANDFTRTEAGSVLLDGALVTYERVYCPGGIANCRHLVRTLDLRTGAVVAQDEKADDATDLVGAWRGSFVLWTDDGVIANHVIVAGPDGEQEVGHGRIERSSVAIGKGIVYWTAADGIHSARIPTPPPLDANSSACAERGTTVDASEAGRVYALWTAPRPRVFACLYGHKARLLGRLNYGAAVANKTFVRDVALNGSLLTYATETCGADLAQGCHQRVITVSLRGGTVTRSFAADAAFTPVLVIASDGSFAVGYEEAAGGADIVAVGPGGARVLDRADSGIDIWSLGLGANGNVYWYHGDELRTGRLS
ncbi:MAG: hypothetical protein QOG63_2375 [Thermoleophilaceae bacterium]|nr:hypothetical protein [Thermoleophilaceae bacterium]